MNDRPWMIALEQHVAALAGHEELLADTPTLASFGDESIPLAERLRDVRNGLKRAETYAWYRETWEMVIEQSRTVPDEAPLTADLLPSPCGWMWCADGELPDDPHAHGLLWVSNLGLDEPGGSDVGFVSLFPFRFMPTWDFPREEIVMFQWDFGESLSDAVARIRSTTRTALVSDIEVDRMARLARFFVGGLVFLQDDFIGTTDEPVERHRRKQLARECGHALAIPPTIRVVQLRAVKRPPSTTDTEHQPINWAVQWVVSGHKRMQACGPGHSQRRLIYVGPYVKGPDDKPLKSPTKRVYAVKR